MKIKIGTIYSCVHAFEFRISQHSFYKGLTITLILWKRGVSVTFTTKAIYAAYQADIRERARRHQTELR